MKKILLSVLSVILLFMQISCGISVSDAPSQTEVPFASEPQAPIDIREPVDYRVPITAELVNSVVNAEYKKPKNVIVLIGDGMGPNDIALAEKYGEGVWDFGLILNRLPHDGLAVTCSANNIVTDSAASATALSTGKKTDNGMIGRLPDGTDLKTMAETAREYGKKVGIVTDDEIYGATPSAFVTHSDYRYNYGEITAGLLVFAPEVMIGANLANYTSNLGDGEKTMFESKYNIADGVSAFSDISEKCKNDGKMFAGFNGGCSENISDHLALSAETALGLLENENGFFLLIESAGTDVYGHANNMKGKLSGVVNLDKTLSVLLLFMEKNPDTLLVITSDHETGGVKLPEGDEKPNDGLFTVTTHTSQNVRVFALGMGSELFDGKTVDNTEIAKFVKSAVEGKLGAEE